MKKSLISLLIMIVLLILPSALAINLEIERLSRDEVIIHELNNPAVFELEVKNLGNKGKFRFESIPGFFIMDSKEVELQKNEAKTITLNVYKREDFEYSKFFYTLQYVIRGSGNETQPEELTVRIVELKNAFEVGGSEIDPDSSSVNIYIKNKENFDFKDVEIEFSSEFFKTEKKIDLDSKEKEEFFVELNKEDFKKLSAGFYTMRAKVNINGNQEEFEGTLKFSEKELIISEKKDYGLFIVTKIISKINEGNTEVPSDTSMEKNIISRLFTTFNPEPDVVEREGTKVKYTWNKIIKPGEKLDIVVKTNWLFPFIIIILIIAIVVFAKQSSGGDIILRKKVSFVKTKGGEFALKVSLIANAKKYIERINVVDKLPPLVKVHERFGSETPSRIDEKNRRVEWDLEKLEPGEIRMFNYIIYSKMGILGKFALPAAKIFYELNGRIKETTSNMAFFVSEQTREQVRDEY